MKKSRILSALLAFVTAAGTAIGAAGVTAAESPYKDVKTGRWSFDEIMYATENGYMNGKGGGLFAPEETMSRAMVVEVLYRFQGEPKVNYQAKFSDVKAKDWFADAVLWASENNIVNGVEAGKFAPNEDVTRQQLAAILMRYAPMEYIKDDSRKDITGYKDYKKVQAYAKDAMSWANATGLITGVTTTNLEPAKGATREQFAVILKRFKEGAGFDYELVYNTPAYSTDIDQSIKLVTDADIYVAVDGKDTNKGTLDSPVATLARAKEMVRELKKTAKDEIVVAFKAGNYGALEKYTFTAEDSGTPDVPIRYTAYGDGEVIFSNGVIIGENEFKPIEDSDRYLFKEKDYSSIYKVDLTGRIDRMSDKNVLFSKESGVCHEARYPNKNGAADRYYTDMTTPVDPYSSIQLQALLPKLVEGFRTTEGMKITGHLRRGFLVDTFLVKSYDPETKILVLDIENTSFEGTYSFDIVWLGEEGRFHDDVFFSNLSDQLDAAGEYWFDPDTKVLYVYEPSGGYSIAGEGGSITLESCAEHITFDGFTFDGMTSNVISSSAQSITVSRCTFGNISGQFVTEFNDAKNITVKDCEFYNFVACAISLHEKSNKALLISANNVVSNNYFHDFGIPKYFESGIAIGIYDSVSGIIEHNVFARGAHGGIRLYDCIDTVIEYNVFDRMMQTTKDFGAVYMFGAVYHRSNVIRYNLFERIASIGGAYGIYIDDHSSGQEVYGNIFYDAGDHAVVLHMGRDNDVHDNLIVCSGENDSDFLMYTEGINDSIVDGVADTAYPSTFWKFLNEPTYFRPAEGEEGYELWKSRWPILYESNLDVERLGEYNCLFTIINYIRNNVMIGTTLGEQDPNGTSSYDLYGVVNGNVSYTLDENPMLADPTHGDYTVTGGAGVIGDEHIAHMNRIGLK